jgi:predicted nucleotidyltransferase component of viral defense system
MKTIPDELKSDIEDAATAGMLGTLAPAVVEKDIHITDALVALAKIRLTHVAHQLKRTKGDPQPATREVSTHLIFAGGTCLAKAHGLIERMSEDIDIKVVLEDIPVGYALPKRQADRKRLGDLHDEVERRLTDLGFEYATVEDGGNPLARDSRRYYCLAVSYGAHFRDVSGALRPELKLELIHRPPKLPTEELEMGYMLDRFIPRERPHRFTMTCISVAETLAEKVLSMLRRCAWNWDGHQRDDFDTALVRHIHDVWRIVETHPEAVDSAHEAFAALVAKDAEEFRGQHPGFDEQPYAVLQRALNAARTHKGIRQNFEERLKPLLFSEDKPAFDICFATFAATAERLLEANSSQLRNPPEQVAATTLTYSS